MVTARPALKLLTPTVPRIGMPLILTERHGSGMLFALTPWPYNVSDGHRHVCWNVVYREPGVYRGVTDRWALPPQVLSSADDPPSLPHLLLVQPPAAALAAADVCPTVLHALVSAQSTATCYSKGSLALPTACISEYTSATTILPDWYDCTSCISEYFFCTTVIHAWSHLCG